jgi:cleavage and polyadenylation specificity factor subunit 1
MDGKMPRPKIRSCSISDPFVLILREDDSLGLFIGEPDRGKIRRKDMSPMGDKVCRAVPSYSLTLTHHSDV